MVDIVNFEHVIAANHFKFMIQDALTNKKSIYVFPIETQQKISDKKMKNTNKTNIRIIYTFANKPMMMANGNEKIHSHKVFH